MWIEDRPRDVAPSPKRRPESFKRADTNIALPVLTRCPTTNEVTATHAIMSRRALSKLKSDLCYYCSVCESPHTAIPSAVWIGADHT
jgi:hypothetical protein